MVVERSQQKIQTRVLRLEPGDVLFSLKPNTFKDETEDVDTEVAITEAGITFIATTY